MRRRLFALVSLLSLLLCAATVVLWACRVHSGYILVYGNGDMGTRPSIEVLTADGGIGIGWTYTDFFGKENMRIVPFPATAAIFSIIPCVWIVRRFRTQHDPIQCSVCSYDLTGNISGVCPECGTAINSALPAGRRGG